MFENILAGFSVLLDGWPIVAALGGLALGVVHYITDRDVHDKDEIMRRLIADLRADDSDTRAQLHSRGP